MGKKIKPFLKFIKKKLVCRLPLFFFPYHNHQKSIHQKLNVVWAVEYKTL